VILMTATSYKAVVEYYAGTLRNQLDLGPRHLLMYLAGRFQGVRVVAVAYSRRHPQAVPLTRERSSLLESADIDEAVVHLNERGVYGGLRLSSETLKELHLFCDS
jgi:hypothetical protein